MACQACQGCPNNAIGMPGVCICVYLYVYIRRPYMSKFLSRYVGYTHIKCMCIYILVARRIYVYIHKRVGAILNPPDMTQAHSFHFDVG